MRRFVRNEGGAAAVEFGFIAPIVAAVLIGVGTMGGLILAHNKMRQAISSGAQYVMTVGSEDTTAIEDVVEAAWENKPDSAVVTATKACVCGSVTHGCETLCDDGDYPEKVITINTSMTYAGFGEGTRTITAQDQVRTW